jgi:hypothetical protein
VWSVGILPISEEEAPVTSLTVIWKCISSSSLDHHLGFVDAESLKASGDPTELACKMAVFWFFAWEGASSTTVPYPSFCGA